MGLRRANLRDVTVRKQLARGVRSDDERPAFETEGERVPAVLQPLSGRLEAAIYGERLKGMLLMLAESRTDFAVGMGVRVGDGDGECDYRIVEPPRACRGHTRIVLERL